MATRAIANAATERARKAYAVIPRKTAKEDPARYTKTAHEYGDFLLRGGHLHGGLQRDIVYWIMRSTIGDAKRPEWAKLSIRRLAALCGDAEPKNILTALTELERAEIIQSRERKGCSKTTAKMYKVTPEKWAKLPKRKPRPEPEAKPEAKPEAPAQESIVQPGRCSRPQPVGIQMGKDAAPVTVRVVYNPLGFDRPVRCRATTGKNGRLVVTFQPHESGEGEAKNCSRTRLQFENPAVDNTRLAEFDTVLNRLTLKYFAKAADQVLLDQVTSAAGSATAEHFEQLAEQRLSKGGRIRSGLLVNIAEDAARSEAARERQEAAQRARREKAMGPPPTPEELAEIDRKVAEWRAEDEEAERRKNARR